MIKIALKHFIYEKCINVLFRNITKNFVHPKLGDVRVGAKFRWINYRYDSSDIDSITLYNCEIVDIDTVFVCIRHDNRIEFNELEGTQQSFAYTSPINWRIREEDIIRTLK